MKTKFLIIFITASALYAGLLFLGTLRAEAQADFVFSKTMRKGGFGTDVSKLQEVLATMPDIYPEKLITGYFGVLTRQAVQRFQSKYNIVSTGDESTTGYGLVGPKTRVKLNELKSSSAFKPPSQSATTTSSATVRKPNPEKCPDNIWDEAEQKDLNLCPEDNPINNPKSVVAKITPQASSSPPVSTTMPSPQPTTTTSDSEYLAFLDKLPKLSAIETWGHEYDVMTGGAFVPDIAEYNGKFYMYAFLPLTGIVSFSSFDGRTWTKDAGTRVADGDGLQYSHPYTAIAPDGKLYLFMQTIKRGTLGMYVSLSESSDGLNFTKPQLILKGEDFGGTHAAHGRIIKLNDGKYLLAVSTGINGRGPEPGSGLLYSSDLKVWNFSSIYFAGCHDPTLNATSDGIRLYCHFQAKQTVRFDSSDGYKWDPQSPVGLVEFLDQNGTAINGEDIDIYTFNDGGRRMFISLHLHGPPFGSIWSTVKK